MRNAFESGSGSAWKRASSVAQAVPRGTTPTLLALSTLTIMAAGAIAPALPAIEAHFAGSVGGAALLTRLLVTLPALVIACLAPVAGALVDRFGGRPVLMGSVVLYAIAGTSGLVIDDLHLLLASRGALGIAVAGLMTASAALVAALYVGAQRERFLGWQTALTGLGGVTFMAAGGALTQWDWQATFAVYAVAALMVPPVVAYVRNPLPRPADTVQAGASARLPWGPLCVVYGAAMFNSIVFYLIPTQVPFHLEQMQIAGPAVIGLALGSFNLAFAAASLAYSHVQRKLGPAFSLAAGFALMGIGFGLLGLAASLSGFLASLMVAGAGMSAVIPGLMSRTMAIAPSELQGRAAGGLMTSIFLGQFLSPLLSQWWIGRVGYADAFIHAGALLAVAASIFVVRGWR